LATAALNGDTVAEAKIRKLHNDAVNGDKDALAACRSLRAVVINRKRPTQPVPVSDHTPSEYVATAEDEAQADPVDASGGLDAIGLSPRHAKMLDELRAIRLGVRAHLRSGAPESPRRGAPLRRSA
jgi:hypothetical protein